MADDVDELAELRSVGHGAAISIGGISVQKALLFLTNLALTAGLSVSLYGVYALGWRITRILLRFAPFGSPATLVRLLPKYRTNPAKQNRVLGLAYATAFVATLAIAAFVFVSAEQINAATINHPTFPLVLRLFALLLPFDVGTRVIAYVFRAVEQLRYQVLLVRFVRPVFRLVAVGIALVLGYSVVGVAGALVVATIPVTGLAMWLVHTRTNLRPSLSTSQTDIREFYNYAGPITFNSVGQLLRSRVDVLLVGWLLTSSAAGIYNIVLLLTSIIGIPLIAFNQLFPPIASKLYSDGNEAVLNSIYSTVTRLVMTITVAIAAILFVYRAEILGLFGSEYVSGTLVLTVFVVGRVVGNAVGATGWLLLMTDHQYLRLVNSWMLAGLNVGLSYLFVLEFGLVGAALGTAGSLAAVNLLRLGELWYLEGFQPFTRKFLKPLGAGACMVAVMESLASVLEGPSLLIVGILVGVTTYFAILLALGIEQPDRVLFQSLYRGCQSKITFR